jgi:hypothetical protein
MSLACSLLVFFGCLKPHALYLYVDNEDNDSKRQYYNIYKMNTIWPLRTPWVNYLYTDSHRVLQITQ